MDTVLPPDLAALYALLSSPIFAGAFLTWFIGHLPLVKNDERADWLKFTLAVLVCLVWAFVVTFFGKGGLPSTANGWYTIVVLGLGIAIGNQAFFQVWSHIPALRDFLLALRGKTSTVTVSTTTGENGPATKALAATTTTVSTELAAPPPVTDNTQKLPASGGNA